MRKNKWYVLQDSYHLALMESRECGGWTVWRRIYMLIANTIYYYQEHFEWLTEKHVRFTGGGRNEYNKCPRR